MSRSNSYAALHDLFSKTAAELNTKTVGVLKRLTSYLPCEISLDSMRKWFKPNSKISVVAITSLLKLWEDESRNTENVAIIASE
jgi:hypothetical protein